MCLGFFVVSPTFQLFCSIWVQILTEDLLGIEYKDDLKESLSLINSLDPPTNEIRDYLVNSSKIQISEILNTYKKQVNPYLPAHHLWGGEQILEKILINELINKKKLFICGSPSFL